jgi:hypothetical protein
MIAVCVNPLENDRNLGNEHESKIPWFPRSLSPRTRGAGISPLFAGSKGHSGFPRTGE